MILPTEVSRKRCVILGAGGFLGTNLAIALQNAGAYVVACGRSRPYEHPVGGIEWHYVNIDEQTLSSGVIGAILEGADVVFHLAGTSTPAEAEKKPVADLNRNIHNILGLLDVCGRKSIDRIVFASSGGTVYGAAGRPPFPESIAPQPIGIYGIGKLAIEHLLLARNIRDGMRNVVLRISNPYGPYQSGANGQGVIPIFARRAIAGETVQIWGDGSMIRDYVAASDVADAFMRAAVYQGRETTFNIGSGVGRSLLDVVSAISQALDREVRIEYRAPRTFDIMESILDCRLAEREIDWKAASGWKDSVAETCKWIEDESKIIRDPSLNSVSDLNTQRSSVLAVRSKKGDSRS